MADDVKQLVHRIFDMVNSGDFTNVTDLIHAEYVDHSGPFGEFHGPEGFTQLITMFRSVFPDLHIEVEDVIAEGDLAAWRSHGTGTHRGELMGMPPTNKRVELSSVDMGRMRDGKAVEHWPGSDNLGMLMQLGVIPPMGAPSQ